MRSQPPELMQTGNRGDGWNATGKALRTEANSLGDLLLRLRERISPLGIDGASWDTLLEGANRLPSSLAAFPFGFELRLKQREPRADFGVSLMYGGIGIAALFDDKPQSLPNHLSPTIRLLDSLDHDAPVLAPVRACMLEYESDPALPDAMHRPGVFLYPFSGSLDAETKSKAPSQDLERLAEGLVSLGGWTLTDGQRRMLRQAERSLPIEASVRSLGVFPARGRHLRFAGAGFPDSDRVAQFLSDARQPEASEAAADVISMLESTRFLTDLCIQLDIYNGGFGQRLGLSFTVPDNCQRGAERRWNPILETLADRGLALPHKLSMLTKMRWGVDTLYGRSGRLLLSVYLSHIKIVLGHGGIEEAKAYVGLRMGTGSVAPNASVKNG